jgi:YD repeat-containing protein
MSGRLVMGRLCFHALWAIWAALLPHGVYAETIQSVTQYSYDDLGRPLCTAIRMDPAQWGSQTDACAPQTTGPNGPDRVTKSIYDAAGQLLQVRRAVGTSLEQAYATYAYSADGKRTVVVDASGNRAELRYDGFDRQDRWTFPSTTALSDTQRAAFTAAIPSAALGLTNAINTSDYEQYGYDANGNRTSLKKRDGSTLTYQYDALNRMTVKVVPEHSGTPAWATRDVYYSYDLRGLQTSARFDSTSGEGLITAYDGLGRMTSSSLVMDGVTRDLSHHARDASRQSGVLVRL